MTAVPAWFEEEPGVGRHASKDLVTRTAAAGVQQECVYCGGTFLLSPEPCTSETPMRMHSLCLGCVQMTVRFC